MFEDKLWINIMCAFVYLLWMEKDQQIAVYFKDQSENRKKSTRTEC